MIKTLIGRLSHKPPHAHCWVKIDKEETEKLLGHPRYEIINEGVAKYWFLHRCQCGEILRDFDIILL